MTTHRVVGRPVPRLDAADKATGRLLFGADLKLPGMLVGKVLRSAHPHARLMRIDTSRAEALPGVLAVVTARDAPEATFGALLDDRPIMAREKVRFRGEPVAAVAAVDEETALEALNYTQVEYEILPALFDPLEAMRPGVPLIHERLREYRGEAPGTREGNICSYVKGYQGDVEQGFAEADEIFEDTYTTSFAHQAYLEPHAATASWDVQGRLSVWTTTQQPFEVREYLHKTLGMPLGRIRVVPLAMGGGFGGKIGMLLEPIAALLARKAGRPVALEMSFEEEFQAGKPRSRCFVTLKTGVKRDGTITARQATIVYDVGAYFGLSASVGALLGRGPYRVEHTKIDSYCVYTNNLSTGPCRAPGGPQITFAIESQMDDIARRLGIDPLKLRLKNCLRTGDPTPSGGKLPALGMAATLERVGQQARWGQVPREPYRGIGVACGQWFTARGPFSASVSVDETEIVRVLSGAVDITGTATSLAQIAAEELGVALDQVQVIQGDTDLAPHAAASEGSQVTYNMGNAVRAAAAQLRAKLVQLAAAKLEASPEDLELQGGRVVVKGSPEKGVSLGALAQAHAASGGGLLMGTGSVDRLPSAPSFASEVAEVRVDPETGQVALLRLVGSQDVGFAINPLSVEGQIQGGMAMGVGYALTEAMVLEEGTVKNPSFLDYKIPTALDMPQVKPVIVEEPAAAGPYGARGAGEVPIVPTAAAIGNAICDATGLRLRDLPMTAERLLAALREMARANPS